VWGAADEMSGCFAEWSMEVAAVSRRRYESRPTSSNTRANLSFCSAYREVDIAVMGEVIGHDDSMETG
jgi:hypothetical protein